MRQKLLLFFILVMTILMAGCTKMVPADTDAIPSAKTSEPLSQPVEQRQISRAQAGLSTIPVVDITNIPVNSRVAALLQGADYLDNDYEEGIVEGSRGLILSERFSEKILGNLRIGTDMKNIQNLLGVPSVTKEDYIFYKTNRFYLAFRGRDKLEAAALCTLPDDYDKDILNKLIAALRKEGRSDLQTLLQEDENIRQFFDREGHIHGGGWYVYASCGVTLEDFDQLTFTVYNNFEGNLYSSLVAYEDQDYLVNELKMSLEAYEATNQEFASKEAKLSPTGKYNSIFRWITSDSQYFIIRSMDNSRADRYIAAPAGQYRWVNDDYLIYMDAFSTLPFAVPMDDGNDDRVNIFYELGLIDSNDSTIGIGTNNYELTAVLEKEILLRDASSGKELRIQYEVDPTGKIKFKI